MTALVLALMMQATTCSWMTQATADRIVGGKTALAVTSQSCSFSHDRDFLRIDIPASTSRVCKSAPEALKGIGNEASVCDGPNSEQIVTGRVRKQIFVLTLKAPFSRDLLRAKVRAAADIVSGNLY